jgi:protein-disulfide isomerase
MHDRSNQIPTNLRRVLLLAASLGLGAIGLFLLGEPEPGLAEERPPEKLLATVGSVAITEAEVMDSAAGQLVQLARQRHQLLTNVINDKVRTHLVEMAAEAAGLSQEAFLNKEVVQKSAAVPQEKVEAFYQARRNQIRQPLEAVAQPIREFLAMEALVERLEKVHEVEVLLDPFRVDVPPVGPSKGPADAPVTIVEFSDFQCPFCSRVTPTLDAVQKKFGDKLRIVFRQFPLEEIHKEARKAGEAALCAAEQDYFWQMHDAMFADQAKLDIDGLKATAAQIEGLDAEAFGKCLDSSRQAAKVDEDLQAGARVGVSSTPALFVNGRFLTGAMEEAALSAVIEDELKRLGS